MKEGKIPCYGGIIRGGLCSVADKGVISENILNLFNDDFPSFHYWADGKNKNNSYERRYVFTPLPQTIVLFMAAMNNEL